MTIIYCDACGQKHPTSKVVTGGWEYDVCEKCLLRLRAIFEHQEWTEDAVTVTLTIAGMSPINVIKAVRGLLGVGLKEAKELVIDRVPSVIKTGVPRSQGEAIAKTLRDAGATVVVE
jgi:ribosomal protein L7/L12